MKTLLTILVFAFCFTNTHAQILKKIMQKAEEVINKPSEKKGEPTTEPGANEDKSSAKPTTNLKVYNKFDFVPGKTILYFDNFEKDNIGETPLGWMTSASDEVVTVEGLEGKWVKMQGEFSKHVSRNKKQSWGKEFTIEFDLLIAADGDRNSTYSFMHFFNTGGMMVTDENLLPQVGQDDMKNSTCLFFRLAQNYQDWGHTLALTKDGNKAGTANPKLPDLFNTPVHVAVCVQGKRFRLWLNETKVFDASAAMENSLPNQLAFMLRDKNDYYISNIRVAKDIPDTRAAFADGKITSNLLFFTGTAKLRPESMGALNDISKVLKEATDKIKIVGHTDSDGDKDANQKLSEQRAEAVKTILIKEYGIDADKITTEGRGAAQPIAENKSAEGKAQNRRVEFIFKAEADNYVKPTGMKAK